MINRMLSVAPIEPGLVARRPKYFRLASAGALLALILFAVGFHYGRFIARADPRPPIEIRCEVPQPCPNCKDT